MPASVSSRGLRVAALGEIAIRVRDMQAMRDFRTDMPARFSAGAKHAELHSPGIVPPQIGAGSSPHRIAPSIGHEDQGAETQRYDSLERVYCPQDFPCIGRRGVFTADPDGNTVEFVAATGKGPQPS